VTQIAERIAAGMLVSLIGGFLVAVTLATLHIDRAVIIWLLTVLCCGLVVGSTTETFSIRLKPCDCPGGRSFGNSIALFLLPRRDCIHRKSEGLQS
jgi:hypothetical protein